MRKTRLWVCPCCHRAWSRKKGDTVYNTHQPRCRVCDLETVAARKWPDYRTCKHERAREKVAAFEEKQYSRVRAANGHIFKPSRETKKLWRKVREAQRFDSVKRRSDAWLTSLYHDSRQAGDQYAKYISKNGVIYKGRYGMYADEKIEIKVSGPGGGAYGTFSMSEGIVVHKFPEAKNTEHLRNTIVHEATHMLDAYAHIKNDGHGKYWAMRFAQMLEWFPTEDK